MSEIRVTCASLIVVVALGHKVMRLWYAGLDVQTRSSSELRWFLLPGGGVTDLLVRINQALYTIVSDSTRSTSLGTRFQNLAPNFSADLDQKSRANPFRAMADRSFVPQRACSPALISALDNCRARASAHRSSRSENKEPAPAARAPRAALTHERTPWRVPPRRGGAAPGW